MMRVLVTYKVKPDRGKENGELVRAVCAELREINDPDVNAPAPDAEKQRVDTARKLLI